MNIKILDSELRKYLKTKATPHALAEKLSLTSMSVERIEKLENDYVYEMEITTNRPDLFSVLGIAREAAAILPHSGIQAEFIPLEIKKIKAPIDVTLITIKNDPKLVNRICAVVMEVKIGDSPKFIKEALTAANIRSLNNIIDITNYVMLTIGHPSHVFDFDRLGTKTLTIREALRGEKITTLDNKEYSLLGGEIVAIDENRRIVDLLGIMGLSNSVVSKATKRILYFLDNNEPSHIRNASMGLGIRTEAANLNEKGIDPELATDALLYGIELFEDLANAKIISGIIDIYPNKPKEKTIQVDLEKINSVMGIKMDVKKAVKSLSDLGFKVTLGATFIKVLVPTFRTGDMETQEDVIEEIARIYGYHNLPSILPQVEIDERESFADEFFWEKRVKEALKYWGFIETYTYSFVPENMFEGPTEDSVFVTNPLNEDFVYMRNTLIPSLLKVVSENKKYEKIKIFEIANIYLRTSDLPSEILTLSGIVKKSNASFYEVKGIIEQLLFNLGIKNAGFKKSKKGGMGASVYIDTDYIGEIEVLDSNLIDFELNFEIISEHASLKKEFKSFAKYPPIVEDLSILAGDTISTEELIEEIKKTDIKIVDATLLDSYNDSRTFHIVYQDIDKNLTNEEVKKIKEKLISNLQNKFSVSFKA
jgi:phenylalanyl-tRNA synthetase beta chain